MSVSIILAFCLSTFSINWRTWEFRLIWRNKRGVLSKVLQALYSTAFSTVTVYSPLLHAEEPDERHAWHSFNGRAVLGITRLKPEALHVSRADKRYGNWYKLCGSRWGPGG